MMQTTACNALHHVQQRCARWLLMTHDRMHEQDFHLSHEFLAVMLGVQRPTVTTVAGGLQQAGLIRYTHGRVSVLDRRGLEAASCECYAIVRAHFDRFARPGGDIQDVTAFRRDGRTAPPLSDPADARGSLRLAAACVADRRAMELSLKLSLAAPKMGRKEMAETLIGV
jgi:hypothetical protein